MASKELKYKIDYFLSLLPRHISIGSIEGILLKEHKISRDTFYRDRNVKLKDSFSIPSERLDIYAKLFSVNVDDLKNYTVKVKALTDRKLSDFESNVANKSGLKKK